MAAEREVDLEQGITYGERTYHQVTVREPRTGDVIEAQEESERLVPTPEGYQLVSSPSRVGLNVLRRQIVRIGRAGEQPVEGPVGVDELHRFGLEDFNRIQRAADELDGAGQAELANEQAAARGRGEGEDSGD